MEILRVCKPRKIKKVKQLTKSELETKRKEIFKRIVALDCTTGDYVEEVEELYVKKREIDFKLKSF